MATKHINFRCHGDVFLNRCWANAKCWLIHEPINIVYVSAVLRGVFDHKLVKIKLTIKVKISLN